MKSKNEIPAIFFFLQLYKEVIVYIFLDSNAAALKVFLKFVIPCKFSSAIFTQPSAMSLYHRQTKEINCASHKSNLIYNKNGASSNCLPELVRLSLISGSSLNQSTEEPWVAGGFTLRYEQLVLLRSCISRECWEPQRREPAGAGHRLSAQAEWNVSVSRSRTQEEHCTQTLHPRMWCRCIWGGFNFLLPHQYHMHVHMWLISWGHKVIWKAWHLWLSSLPSP